MTNKDIYREMGGIDPRLIMDAAPAEKKQNSKSKTWVKWASLAACFALLLCIGIPLTIHFMPDDDIIDDQVYPFDCLAVGESTTYDNGTISYDEHNGTSISFTINVTDPTEYMYREYRLSKNYYIEHEENGKITANHGYSGGVNELFSITVNGEPINEVTDEYGNVDYDFRFITTPGTYKVIIDYSKLFEADGNAAMVDFVISGIVAFDVFHFENPN